MTVLDWDHRVAVIGEVGQAHDGSLGTAHAYIDAIADAVKFQTHIAAAEIRAGEPWRVRFSYSDDTRDEYWKRMEFTPHAWDGLRQHAQDRGLVFVSSPFSLEAAGLLRRVGVAAWKIASGEVANPQVLDAVAQTGQPVLLSSGMSGWAELGAAVTRLRAGGAGPLAVLQCTSACPVAPQRAGLNVLGEIAALRLRRWALRSLRDDLPGARRGHPRRACDRGARDTVPGNVRPRRGRAGDHQRAAHARRRCPLYQRGTRGARRQGPSRGRAGTDARALRPFP